MSNISHPKVVTKRAKNRVSRTRKVRITTYLDRDLLMWLKVRALEERAGYQTVLNRLLRFAVDRVDAPLHEPAASAVALRDLEHKLDLLAQEVAEAKRSPQLQKAQPGKTGKTSKRKPASLKPANAKVGPVKKLKKKRKTQR